MVPKPSILIEKIIPAGRVTRPGTPLLTPSYITIHDTANTAEGADALNHATWLAASSNKPDSWHFTVDDKVIIQHLPLTEHGWHCGDGELGYGNHHSIGIEVCEHPGCNRTVAEANAITLTGWLMDVLKIPLSNVVPHAHWVKKYCPHLILPHWDQFISDIKDYHERFHGGRFSDVPKEYWAFADIESAATMKLMGGVGDGKFEPERPLTRAELAAVVVRLVGYLRR